MSKTSTIGGIVRKFILIVLLLVAPHSLAIAPNAPVQNPVDAFLKTQNDKTDPILNAQISELRQAGYTERGTTGAVDLGGGCGVVGCYGSSLVTTVYFNPGSNSPSTIVAAIATNSPRNRVRVSRILTRAEIERLVNPK